MTLHICQNVVVLISHLLKQSLILLQTQILVFCILCLKRRHVFMYTHTYAHTCNSSPVCTIHITSIQNTTNPFTQEIYSPEMHLTCIYL